MILDFYTFIITNSTLTDIQQDMFLDDFCKQYGFVEDLEAEEPTITKQEFLNSKVTEFLQGTVNAQRRKAEIEAVQINACILKKV